MRSYSHQDRKPIGSRSQRQAAAVLLLCVFSLCGCVNLSLPPLVLAGDFDAAVGAPAAAAVAEDPFRLRDQDRQWLSKRIDASWSETARFRALLKLFEDDGELALEYDLAASTSASHTLTARCGNCLSFTVLFVALARALDLDAQVQEVSIAAAWSRLGEVEVGPDKLGNKPGTRYEVPG